MWDAVGDRWLYTLPRITLTVGLQESAIPQLKRLILRRSVGMLIGIPLFALNLNKQMTLTTDEPIFCLQI